MRIRSILFTLTLLLCGTTPSFAQEGNERLDALSQMLQKALVAQAPKQFEEKSAGWGKTIPIPNRLILRRLRKRVKVGDREELPHGAWIRTIITLDDPNKDIQIRVREMKMLSAGKMRLKVRTTVTSSVEREHQQWQKGLLLLVVISEADTVVVADVECEANFGLNTTKFPPAFEVKAEVKDVRLSLEKFTMRRIAPFVQGEKAENIGNQMKDVVEALIKAYELDVKEQANKAIAKVLKEGKGPLSPKNLLKMPAPPSP